MSKKNLSQICNNSLSESKAENILLLNVKGISSFADKIIIATANSNRHAASVSKKLVDNLKENNINIISVEGELETGWILVDCGDVVVNIMKHPQTMIASDGRLVKLGDGHPHPRWYGTFPRVLGQYVREKKVLSLKEALHKMTALPAAAMGLKDRGMIAEGYKADLTLFNPDTVVDLATFEKPHQYSKGIEYVIINGKLAIDQTEFKAVKSGQVLKKNAL